MYNGIVSQNFIFREWIGSVCWKGAKRQSLSSKLIKKNTEIVKMRVVLAPIDTV